MLILVDQLKRSEVLNAILTKKITRLPTSILSVNSGPRFTEPRLSNWNTKMNKLKKLEQDPSDWIRELYNSRTVSCILN